MTHPTPTHPTPTHPDGGSGTGPKFRPPLPRTPLNALISCGRAWGAALVAVAELTVSLARKESL